MNTKLAFGLLAFLAIFVSCIVAENPLCGNSGEDYFYLRDLYINGGQGVGYPQWLFPRHYYNDSLICTPTCNSTTGYCPEPHFHKNQVDTYDYSCSINNLTAVQNIVDNLKSFGVGIHNSSCACELPPTPAGKYLNGYTVTVFGKIVGAFDGTVEYYKGCEVVPSYQDTPLTIGDIFKQIFIINSGAQVAASLFMIACFALAAILFA